MASAPLTRRAVASVLPCAQHSSRQQARTAAAVPVVKIRPSRDSEVPRRAFDYDAFFREETAYRLRNGMYDFFLPLHNRADSELPYQAGAALDMYKETREIIPALDAMLEGMDEAGDVPARLEQITAGLKDVTIFATTDYLGLSTHPLLVETLCRFTRRHGVSCTGSRYITGNSLYQQLLERECARMHRLESSLLFLSCFDANNCVLSCLGSWLPGCVIYSDAGNHASIVEGVQRSGASKRIYRHCDVEHLDELMAADCADDEVDGRPRPKVVVFESVYSMTGDVCPVPEIVAVARRHGALTFVDEAHSLGVFGARGRGLLEQQGCEGAVDIVASTLGKAAGFQGGYVAGSLAFTEAVRHRARGYVFTSTLSPGMAAAGLAALRLLQGAEGAALRAALFANVALVRRLLGERRIPCVAGAAHIVPVCVHDADKAQALCRALLRDYGVYVPAARSPAVPRGRELLRVIPMPGHTAGQINHLVEALAVLWKEHDLAYSE